MAALCAGVATAGAQAPARAPTGQPEPLAVVSGRVVTPGAKEHTPIAGAVVTVHRVGPDSSGALDSVRTDALGRYTVNYRRFGDDAVYFAATVYRGIAYFSAPLQGARTIGDDAEITVFDTTSHAIQMHTRGHHLVVSAPRPDGNRDVVEVWEISNDTSVTVIGRDSLSAVWTAPLPGGVTKVTAGQGDVSKDAIVARGKRVALLASFGPGVKQVSYSYSVPRSEFPLKLPIDRATDVLELLLEEPTAQVTGGALQPTDAATTGGRTFKRFLGQDIPAGTTLEVTVPTTQAATRTWVFGILSASIALVMAGSFIGALRRRNRARPPGSPPDRADVLLESIAQLDERRERGDPTLDEMEYARQRAVLKSQLAGALAERNSAT